MKQNLTCITKIRIFKNPILQPNMQVNPTQKIIEIPSASQ